MSNLKTVVYQRLEAIANAEKITRVELAAMSRELLMYVPETNDIDIVNRLINVLTRVNQRAAIHYFAHFLPWEEEKDPNGVHVRFGSKVQGAKKIARCEKAIKDWLAEEANNIWTWSDANLDVEKKKKDFYGTIQRDIKKAIEGDEKTETPPLPIADIMRAVMAGGVPLDAMLQAIEVRQAELASVMQPIEEPKAEEPKVEEPVAKAA